MGRLHSSEGLALTWERTDCKLAVGLSHEGGLDERFRDALLVAAGDTSAPTSLPCNAGMQKVIRLCIKVWGKFDVCDNAREHVHGTEAV